MKTAKYGYAMVLLCLLVTSGTLFSGCMRKHDYVWAEYAILPERLSTVHQLVSGGKISLVNGQSDSTIRDLGNIGPHHYFGSLSQLTQAIIDQLSSELEDREITVAPGEERTLTINVVDAQVVRGVWRLRAELDVQVQTGDHFRMISVGNKTPHTIPHGYNGAVALAVIEILNDPKIIAYINGGAATDRL